jgi:phosphoenolpyruvate carboxylase
MQILNQQYDKYQEKIQIANEYLETEKDLIAELQSDLKNAKGEALNIEVQYDENGEISNYKDIIQQLED